MFRVLWYEGSEACMFPPLFMQYLPVKYVLRKSNNRYVLALLSAYPQVRHSLQRVAVHRNVLPRYIPL